MDARRYYEESDMYAPRTYDSNNPTSNMRKKSVKPGLYLAWGGKRRIYMSFKKAAAFLAATSLSFALAIGSITNLVSSLKDNFEINSYLSGYATAISAPNATYRVGERNEHYAYNENVIAKGIISSENPEYELYNTYRRIQNAEIESYLKIENLNKIVRALDIYINDENATEELADLDGCNSWDDILNKRMCVDKNGEPSNDIYEEYVAQLVRLEIARNDLEERFAPGGVQWKRK